MKLAIMQPYFFPYLGYFALIKNVDHFMIFDTPQFIRHGWIERNRVLKPDSGWMYIKVPLEKHSRNTAIKDLIVRNDGEWKKKIIAQLSHYKKKARFYPDVMNLLNEIFQLNTDSIVKLDHLALKIICNYLCINTEISIFSEKGINIEKPTAADEWALNIAVALNAHTYINLPGGQSFFEREKYTNKNIELKFMDVNLLEYKQKNNYFEKGLSIIDVLMFNSPLDVGLMLDNYQYI